MWDLVHPFDPIIYPDSKILILGTFPSIKSFEESFYYAHPQNQFWKLLAAVFHEPIPQGRENKELLLKKHHIALWDMVKSCKRSNSLDSSLKDITVNDIEKFLQNYPAIEKICFTSRLAQKLYEKYFSHILLSRYYLPSPSPAYRAINFDEKLKKYKEILL